MNEQEWLKDFLTVFKVCGLQKLLDIASASRVADYKGLDIDPNTFIRSLALDCVRVARINLKIPSFSFGANDYSGRQTPGETLHILTYELGKVIEYFHKAKRYGATGFYCVENQQKEMSDLISMARFYCEQRAWDFSALMRLGEQAYLERQEDLRDYGLGGRKNESNKQT